MVIMMRRMVMLLMMERGRRLMMMMTHQRRNQRSSRPAYGLARTPIIIKFNIRSEKIKSTSKIQFIAKLITN